MVVTPVTGERYAALVERAVEEQLSVVATDPFTPPAFQTLRRRVRDYISDLFTESLSKMKRDGLDAVSESHVEEAARHLSRQRRQRRYQHMTLLGATSCGAAIPLVTDALAHPATQTTIRLIVTGLLLVVGIGFWSYGAAKD
jgi:hypothetical protein